MAKKVKRKVSTVARTQPITDVAVAEPVEMAAAPSSAPSTSTRTFGRRAAVTEFNPDYTYVVKDLKRIGSLAGVFFLILIALSFLMPSIEQMFIK